MEQIKVYGERNSGTIYLEELLMSNTNAHIIRFDAPKILHYPLKKIDFFIDFLYWLQPKFLGWKHSVPPIKRINNADKSLNLKIITITKNPYSYLLSLHRRPYHSKEKISNFEDFLAHPFRQLPRDNFKIYKNRNPIELWNNKNESYLELKNSVKIPVVNLTYEKLILDPESVFESLTEELSISSSSPKFTNVISSTKKVRSTFDDYRDYYLNEKWKEKLSAHSLTLINQFLDEKLMKKFGYDLIHPK